MLGHPVTPSWERSRKFEPLGEALHEIGGGLTCPAAMDQTYSADELFAHREFVWRLAGALLGKEGGVEDAVQETWLAALRRPPVRGKDRKPWLAQVLVNVVRPGRRGEANRVRREMSVAREECTKNDPARALEELERHQLLLSCVQALPDAQREALVERYLRGSDQHMAAKALESPSRLFVPAPDVDWPPCVNDSIAIVVIDARGRPGWPPWCIPNNQRLPSVRPP